MTSKDKTLLQLSAGIEAGDMNPVELIEESLVKAEGSKAVFIGLLANRAREEAEQSRLRQLAGRRLSPLDGIPIAWKDVFDCQGEVTTGGSRVFTEPASRDAEAVRRAGQAGLIPVGKTNMTELAFSGLGLNPHYGTPHATPGDGPARIPGGSSSGSAVAVALGIVAAATGSDTAGSLRIPAAFNGLVSYRSSLGRQSMAGILPLARSLDTPGVLANTLTDCLAVDDAMRLGQVSHYLPRVPEHITVVLDTDILQAPFVSEVVRQNTLRQAEHFEALGVRVVRKPLAATRETLDCIERYGWLGGFEAYAEYKDLLEQNPPDAFDPRVRNRILALKDAAPDRPVRLYWERRRLQQALRRQLDGAILLIPTVAHVAPQMAPLLADDDLYASVNLNTLKLTMIASLLDSPAIALPSGQDADGQFTGVQLMAPQGEDDLLIRSCLTLAK